MYVYIYIVFQNKIVGNLQNDHYFVEFFLSARSQPTMRKVSFLRQSNPMRCATVRVRHGIKTVKNV